MYNPIHQRVKTLMIKRLTGRKTQRTQGPPVKSSQKTNELGRSSMVARQLDRRLNALGARIRHERHRVFFERRNLIQAFP